MIEFDETGLYKGFVKNAKGQKYQSGRNPKIMSLQEANQYEGFSGVMNANTVLLDADEQPYSDILQNIIKGEKLGAYVTDRQGGRGIHVLMINGNSSLKKPGKLSRLNKREVRQLTLHPTQCIFIVQLIERSKTIKTVDTSIERVQTSHNTDRIVSI